MRKAFKIIALLMLLVVTWSVRIYHLGVFPKPRIDENAYDLSDGSALWSKGKWIDKSGFGINQLVVSGSPYERGLIEGHFTKHLLLQEENELTEKLNHFFPSEVMRRGLVLALIRWFWGIEKYFPNWMTEEMYGVSHFASAKFNSFADPFTRQIAYHGLHEVGQMMVDQKGDDMGCTVIASPLFYHQQKKWIIGRNFDFEGGRVFDEDKIMKWVFPDQGYAFLSVIWAGMVGAVTAVNDQGIYISMNAAGSTDFHRYGTPSTLILLQAIQFSKTAEEALEIIKNGQMFITDIFVVSDRKNGKLYRVEKSPAHTEITELTKPSAITNHLLSPVWAKDKINLFRKTELTSQYRLERGTELVNQISESTVPGDAEKKVLSILRDKGKAGTTQLQPGNRRAIDALIATHSVVYNEFENTISVSRGPALSEGFLKFDLEKSFTNRSPTVTKELARDPAVSAADFASIKNSLKWLGEAEALLQHHKCQEAQVIFKQVTDQKSYNYFSVLGDLEKCFGNPVAAKLAWQKALSLSPAYLKEIRTLEAKSQ